jgi:hypothetical protein
MMGFMITAINYDQLGHPGWIVGHPEVAFRRPTLKAVVKT